MQRGMRVSEDKRGSLEELAEVDKVLARQRHCCRR